MFSIGPDKVRVGAVQYSHKKKVEFDINDYLNDMKLRKAVFNIKQLKAAFSNWGSPGFHAATDEEGKEAEDE